MNISRLLHKTWLGLNTSFNRFPAAVGLSCLTALLVIVILEIERRQLDYSVQPLIRLAMTLGLGVFLSLCIHLGLEKRPGGRRWLEAVWFVGAAVALALYYYLGLPDLNWIHINRYIAYLVALILLVLIAQHYDRREHFERHLIRLSIRFCVTVIYAAVLFAGIAALLFTIDQLLNVPVSEYAYVYVWVSIAGMFAPAFFLAGFPDVREREEHQPYPHLLKMLLLNIVMPLIVIYTAILYIYFAKIIVTMQWPVGLVSHLVLWYSVIAIAVILFIVPIRKDSRWAGWFCKWFPILILPNLLMMFISLGIRINAYGVTENRYYAAVLGLWAAGVMIFWAVMRSPRNALVPAILAVLAAAAVTGPWNAFSVSKYSQNERFETILQRNGMLNQGAITPQAGISAEDRQELSQILLYFENRHHFRDVRYLPEDFQWKDMEQVFGFPFESISPGADEVKYFHYYREETAQPVDIRAYDYMFLIREHEQQFQLEAEAATIRYDNSGNEALLQVLRGDKLIYEKRLSEFIAQLPDLPAEKSGALTAEQAMFTHEDGELALQVIVNIASGRRIGGEDRLMLDGLEFQLFLRLK